MKLINAEKLTDGEGVFTKYIHMDFEIGSYIKVGDLIKVLDNLLADYDVNKVLKLLKENADEYDAAELGYVKAVLLEDAIKAVKSGFLTSD